MALNGETYVVSVNEFSATRNCKLKRTDARTEPWGRPLRWGLQALVSLPMCTLKRRSRSSSTHQSGEPIWHAFTQYVKVSVTTNTIYYYEAWNRIVTMAICSCQGRQRQHTDLAVSPSPDLVSGISYLPLCVYHRHLNSFKASWRQYFFARPTRHDSVRSWLLRLLELHLTNFPTYLLTYLLSA